MNHYSATVDFVDVATAYREIAGGTFKVGRHIGGHQDVTGSIAGSGFSGDTTAGMIDKLDHGYSVPGETTIRGRNTRTRRKPRYNEDDGEIQIDRVLAGDDAIYLDRRPRKRQRGIKLEFELGFLGETPASVLADYAVWIGKLLSALEGGGYQTQVDVVSRARNVVKGAELATHIRVKQFGQRGSMRSWSALLSPGGFRHLVFTSRILAADKAGQICRGMGASVHPSWGLTWDDAERKLTVRCKSACHAFPAAQMDAELAAITF